MAAKKTTYSEGQLEKYLVQARRIAEHREAGAEKQIREMYKNLTEDLNGWLGNYYAKYAVDDVLDFGVLRQKRLEARFLEEVQQKVDNLYPNLKKTVEEVVEKTYEICYQGMYDGVTKAKTVSELHNIFKSVSAVTPEQIKAAVKNPIKKLSLTSTLERNRAQIISGIRREITVGLTNGDRMSTVAQRISKYVDSDYKKAMLISRTETHRVREAGLNDAANGINNILKANNSEYRMVKTWHNMSDGAVRNASHANHVDMEGQTVLQDEMFTMVGSGAKADHPGASGVAAEDCNCRCFLTTELMNDAEFFSATGRHFDEKAFTKDNDSGIIKSGTISGALTPGSTRAMKHAEQYYNSVRKMTTDVKSIAENTGFSEKDIQSIKDFIFIEKHDLGGVEKEFFAPSYEMAQSWQRLIDGKNIQSHDITLIKHEIMEKDLISKGMTQDEAHRETSKIYNYKKESEEYYGSIEKNKNDR